MRTIFMLLAFPLMMLLAGSAHAQHRDTLPRFTLVGRVLDYASDARIATAVIEIRELDRRTVADSAGRFAFSEVPEGRYTFVTSRLGYVTNAQASRVRAGYALVVRLLPQPIVLEGLEVAASSLETRRKAVGFSSRVGNRRDLINSAAPNIAAFLRRQQVYLTQCPWQQMGLNCARIRGRVRGLRVYINDVLAPGGAGMLYHYRPADLYRVVTYPSLGMVRIYTPWYVEWVAKQGGHFPALCIVC